MPTAAGQAVTWVRVEKPVFDLAGVLVSSLEMSLICAAVALLFGSLLGAALIRRAAHRQAGELRAGSLGLG
jgi:hypothetical protein